eukprot:c10823_g2_i1 orf=1-420(-)
MTGGAANNVQQKAPTTASSYCVGMGKLAKQLSARSSKYTKVKYFFNVKLLLKLGQTHGMEFHPLAFGKEKRLRLCDLAGKAEFRVIHHYLKHASNSDLFIVICKHQEPNSSQDVFELQLDYWLRFIVSQRSTVDVNDSRV